MVLWYVVNCNSWLLLWEDSFFSPNSWILQTAMEDHRGSWTWRNGSALTSPHHSLKTFWIRSWKRREIRLSQKWVTQNQPPQLLKTQKKLDTRELQFWSAYLKEMLGIWEWYSLNALPSFPLTLVSPVSYIFCLLKDFKCRTINVTMFCTFLRCG